MDLFTEEQQTLLYMIGLNPDRMTEEEKQEIHREITEGVCRLEGDEITLKGCPQMEGRVKRFALRLLERKKVAPSVIAAVRRDPQALLRIRRTPEAYTMTIEYRPSAKGVENQEKETEEIEETEKPEKPEKEKEIWTTEYLEYVHFSQEEDAIKRRLMETIGVSLPEMKRTMLQALESLRQERKDCTPEQQTEWLTCKGGCEKAAKQAIQQECESTAYFLRSLAQSILALEGTPRMEFALSGSPSDLTGRWKEDVGRLRLVGYGGGQTGGRLVMGFGPSASGKTFLTRTLLNLLRKVDHTLPPVFLSIDGDIYRSISYTYDMVKQVASAICAEGFDNLVSSGMSAVFGSLFQSKEIVQAILPFLQSAKERIPIHLYVPDTLGSCLVGSCESAYRRYKELTGDTQWIGLLIWQHRTGKECTFPPGYRCKGCTESGTARQKKDGKKYSNTAWPNSMKNGEAEFLKAPGGSYKIHNSGQKGSTTVIMDHSKAVPTQEKREVFRLAQEGQKAEAGWRYLTHTDAQKYITQFEQDARDLKKRVGMIGSKAETSEEQEEDQEEKAALQQEYERLLRQYKDPLHGIYRALYPAQMVTSDRAMEKLEQRAPQFVSDSKVWEKEHDTVEVKVYYIRHGYSCANAERNTAGSFGKAIRSHTWMLDPPLHPKGIKQAQALGEDLRRYVENGGRVDLLCTSQLFRAIQTGLLLRAALPSESRPPLHVAPHLCEVGITRDNLPDKLERFTDADRKQMETDGPVEVDVVWSRRTKSDLRGFVDGPLRSWLLQRRKEVPDQKQFNVFVVAHSTLIKDTFGVKLDNGQLLPVVYSFTSAGFLLGKRDPTEEERKEIEEQFPSPYSGTTYTVSSACEGACDVLEEISAGLNVQRLLRMGECVLVEPKPGAGAKTD